MNNKESQEKVFNRDLIKWVRDFIKKDYVKESECYICNSNINLELHHLYSVSELFNTWIEKNKIEINSIEDIKFQREVFYKDNYGYLTPENCRTLCKQHHERLHNLYGQRYSNSKSGKVKNWIEVQREKVNAKRL